MPRAFTWVRVNNRWLKHWRDAPLTNRPRDPRWRKASRWWKTHKRGRWTDGDPYEPSPFGSFNSELGIYP